jgi:DNA mismatch repair ATPase MutL
MQHTAVAALLIATFTTPALASTSFAQEHSHSHSSSSAQASASARVDIQTHGSSSTNHSSTNHSSTAHSSTAQAQASAQASAHSSSGDGHSSRDYDYDSDYAYDDSSDDEYDEYDETRTEHRRYKRRRDRSTHRHYKRRRDTHRHDSHCSHQVDAREAMSQVRFAAFLGQIRNEDFSSGRLRVVKMAAQHNFFTSAQITAVVHTMTFSTNRVESAVMLYPRVLDQDAYYQVFAAFTFESNKRDVRKRLAMD